MLHRTARMAGRGRIQAIPKRAAGIDQFGKTAGVGQITGGLGPAAQFIQLGLVHHVADVTLKLAGEGSHPTHALAQFVEDPR